MPEIKLASADALIIAPDSVVITDPFFEDARDDADVRFFDEDDGCAADF